MQHIMKQFMKIVTNGVTYRVKVKKDDCFKVYVFRGDEKMPLAGTSFSLNTSPLIVQSWATENVNNIHNLQLAF